MITRNLIFLLSILLFISCNNGLDSIKSKTQYIIPTDSTAIISWITTVEDCYEVSLVIDTSKLRFFMKSCKNCFTKQENKLYLKKDNYVILTQAYTNAPINRLDDISLYVLRGNDTICSDTIWDVPIKGGQITEIYYPLTTDINFITIINPSNEGEYD